MPPVLRRLVPLLVLATALAAGGCRQGTYFEEPEFQGYPQMVAVDGKPVLWLFVKQEEIRYTTTGGTRRSSGTSRRNVLNHFEIRAYDAADAKPIWRRRVLTFGDGRSPEILGTSESGYLLGQEGDRVWLMIGDAPFAVSAKDGTRLVDTEALEAANPTLRGKLPSEARHFSFDRGLVFMDAQAQRWVVRGDALAAEPYTPPPPVAEPVLLKPNGMPKIIPSRPYGPVHQRQIRLGDRLVGLYSEEEAAAAADDPFGTHVAYPYTIADRGTTARRTFWTIRTGIEEKWVDRPERIVGLDPIAGSPVFLRGRFVKQLPGEEPMRMEDPAGMVVWHVTRMDDAGRLALTRLDEELKPVWTSELPLSENSTANQLIYWHAGDRIAVMGGLRMEEKGRVWSERQLVSVGLATGDVKAYNVTRQPTDPKDPERVE